jgi:probable rRNA maturation factor
MIVQRIAATLEKKEVVAAANKLSQTARLTLQAASIPENASLTILITDDDQSRLLNRQFLGIDSPTDVLSFPVGETDPETGELYLGDVVVSFPRALAQAKAGGHSTAEELDLLVVHGVLHLVGYDHSGQKDKTRMWGIQQSVLTQLGRKIKPPDGSIY